MGIVKDEGLNIDEWIDHYLWQGADRIFIIDNGSRDDTLGRISKWAGRYPVTLVNRPEPHRQSRHYHDVFHDEGIAERFRWLLVADADEFWFATDGEGIPNALQKFEHFDVIYSNWAIFGSQGHVDHPASLRRCLTMRQPRLGPHELSKWIAKTDVLIRNAEFGIHRVFGADSARTITEFESLRLNHYVTQSRRFWGEVKMRRGDVFDPANDNFRDWEKFDAINSNCTVEDRVLAGLVAADGRRDCNRPVHAQEVTGTPAEDWALSSGPAAR